MKFLKRIMKIPDNNVPFELTLNPISGLELIKEFGYFGEWIFKGKEAEKQTKTFMLVNVGYCKDLREVKEKIKDYEIPQGQWIKAFKDKFEPKGIIGIVDDSWVDPGGSASFPVLREYGEAWYGLFVWAGIGRVGRWRWLVACKSGKSGKSLDTGTLDTSKDLETWPLEKLEINGFKYQLIK